MIIINNRQRKIKINMSRLKKCAQTALKELGYIGYDLSILITTNSAIRAYNRDFRHKDKPTDILSFPYHTELQPGQRIQVKFPEDKNLGDIVISPEYVVKKLPELETTLDDRLQVLLVHGICHLLGYDHETDEQYAEMHALEQSLLKKM